MSTLPDRPPVITLAGHTNMTISVGSTYAEPGYTATDDHDGDVTASVTISGTVDSSTTGTYTIRYDVTDSSGNPATQQVRTVRVADTTPPVITLSGQTSMSIPFNTRYAEPGYTATDDYDGDITGSVRVSGMVDATVPDTYTIQYDVADSSGNAAETRIRTVTVDPAPVPISNSTNPVPISNSTNPVPISNSTNPVPISNSTNPVPISNSTNPVPISNSTNPVPISNSTNPIPIRPTPPTPSNLQLHQPRSNLQLHQPRSNLQLHQPRSNLQLHQPRPISNSTNPVPISNSTNPIPIRPTPPTPFQWVAYDAVGDAWHTRTRPTPPLSMGRL